MRIHIERPRGMVGLGDVDPRFLRMQFAPQMQLRADLMPDLITPTPPTSPMVPMIAGVAGVLLGLVLIRQLRK